MYLRLGLALMMQAKLALNSLQFPVSASPISGNAGVHHHSQLQNDFLKTLHCFFFSPREDFFFPLERANMRCWQDSPSLLKGHLGKPSRNEFTCPEDKTLWTALLESPISLEITDSWKWPDQQEQKRKGELTIPNSSHPLTLEDAFVVIVVGDHHLNDRHMDELEP